MALTGLTKVTNIGINTTTIPTLGGSRNTGVVTATTFVGDGSGLSGVTGSGAGVIVRDGGSLVGTAGTINFGTNLNVSAISAGIVTVTNAASATALTNLSDVTISSASNGQILKHNGSVFVNTAETTYSQSSVASGSNVNLRLTDSGGTNDDILITAGSNITFSSVTANGFTIAASGGGGGGLSNVVEDTTPQLGGALDLNNKFITGSGGINVSGVTTSTAFVGNITGNVTGNADTATNSTHVYVTENGSTDENNLIAFVEDAQTSTGNHGLEMDGDLTFNPSTGNLTATKFTGSGVALTGVVTSIVAGSNITLTGGPTGIVTISSSGGGGGGSVSLSGSTNNTVATVTGANALIGEANLTFDGSTLGIAAGSSDNKIQIDGTNPYIQFREGTTNKAYIQWSAGSGYFQLGNEEAGEVLRIQDGESGLVWRVGTNDRTVWTSGNDGASSGLNADLLDGQEGSYYRDADNINAGTLAAARVATLNQDTTGNAGTATTATTATNITVTANNSTNETVYPIFVDGATGAQGAESDTGLSYNPNSGALTSGSFVKSGGSSSQFLKADGSVDSSTYLTSGSYLENVSEDSSPQLGGNLDLNSNNITGTGEIRVVGLITATSAVKTWTLGASGSDHYTFIGDGFTSATNDPDIYLERGKRYAFLNNAGTNHPFWIKTTPGTGTGNPYNTGVTNNGAQSGYVTFNVPWDAPAHLYYQCQAHGNMVGNIYIRGAGGNNTNVGVITATAFVPTTGQLSHRNIIVNGDMSVAQRATTSNNAGIDSVDRFGIGFGGGAITQAQVDLTSSDTPYAYGFRKSYRLTNTTASTTTTTARDIRYQIEAQDIANSGWDSTSSSSEITLSFWFKASVSQTYYVFHYVPDSQKNYNWNFTPTANTWTKITKTIPGASGVTFNNDNGPGMSIQIVAYYGNSFTASTDPTQNQWFGWSGSNRIPNMTNTWAGTTNATFEVTGMQLEVGPVATPFEHRSTGEELARCQRYYIKDTMVREGSGYGVVTVGLDSIVGIQVDFPVTMRDTPNLTLNGTTYRTGGSANAERISPTGFIWGRKQTGSGTFNGAAYATGGYEVSAEL